MSRRRTRRSPGQSRVSEKVIDGVRYLSSAALEEALDRSPRTIYNLEVAGVLPPARRDLSGQRVLRWYPEDEIKFYRWAAEQSGWRSNQNRQEAFDALVKAEMERRATEEAEWQRGQLAHTDDWGDPEPQISVGAADSYRGELQGDDEDDVEEDGDVGVDEADHVGGVGQHDDYRFKQRSRPLGRVRSWVSGTVANSNLKQYQRDGEWEERSEPEVLVPTCPGCSRSLHTITVVRGLSTILVWTCSACGQVADPLGVATVGGPSTQSFGVQQARQPSGRLTQRPESTNPYLIEK
jgi:hypothetical protein